MDKELVEEVARLMQRQHGKEMLGEIQKWEKRPARERSTWRLIARTVIGLVSKAAGDDASASAADTVKPAARKPRARTSRSKASGPAR